ncbi:MAG: phytanoyl-CoA dioxygenase family protein [Pseudomonadota bacterium]
MLTPAQMEHFQTQGFLVVEDLVDQATLTAVRAEYAALLDRLWADWTARGWVGETPDDAGFWDKLSRAVEGGFEWYQPFDISLPHADITEHTPMHFGPAVFDLITHAGVLDLVEDLIGGEITSNPIQHVRIKPPQRALSQEEVRAHITSTDWHQDLGVTNVEADETRFVTVWLAITDATVENGCLQVAPGAWSELLPHCPSRQIGVAKSHIPSHAVPTPVRAGGAVIFPPHTPHASLSNRSDGFRWSFDLRYNVTGQPTGRSQFPEFIARSRKAPESALTDWRLWQAMWETARRDLATGPHIEQHGRWSSDSAYCA